MVWQWMASGLSPKAPIWSSGFRRLGEFMLPDRLNVERQANRSLYRQLCYLL
jgi:hypothetical protein